MPVIKEKKKSKGIVKWALIVLAVVIVYNALSGPSPTPTEKHVEEVRGLVKQKSLFNIGNVDGVHVETLCKKEGAPEGINFTIKDGQGNELPDYRLFFTVDLDGNSPITTKGWKEIKIHNPGDMTMTEAFFLTAFDSRGILDNDRAKMKFVISQNEPAVDDDVWVEKASRVVLYAAAIGSSDCSTLSK